MSGRGEAGGRAGPLTGFLWPALGTLAGRDPPRLLPQAQCYAEVRPLLPAPVSYLPSPSAASTALHTGPSLWPPRGGPLISAPHWGSPHICLHKYCPHGQPSHQPCLHVHTPEFISS